MRLVNAGVLSLTIFGAACGGPGTNDSTRTNLVTPGTAAAPADAARDAHGNPVATAGRSEPASAASHVREVTIPAGTTLPIVLDTAVGSDTSRAEQQVTAHLSRPVTIHGETVLPEGSRVAGVVTDAQASGRVKGRAHVAVRFDSLSPRGDDERYEIRAASIGRTAESTKKKDALEIGAPAAGGALIGALVGGKKGALIGTAVGGGAGTGVVLATKGKEVHLPKGSTLALKLAAPVTVKVRG
jgi:Bacterial conjugation TrbI-like protein